MPGKLFKRGFVSLLVTQFFGAANDNLLKGVLTFGVAMSGIWASRLGDGGQGWVGLCLTIPFIIFSGYGGQIADRISKQRLTVYVKMFEVVIAVIALLGFWLANLWLGLLCMLLLATQSAFFGPAKYGMIPELVDDRDLSQANGLINMFTNIAVIVGTLLSGPIYKAFHPESDPAFVSSTGPQAARWIPGVALLVIAVLGLLAAFSIPRLAAKDPDLEFDTNPVKTYIVAIREMATGSLLTVALAWSFFYLIGMLALLILPDYKALLGIDPVKASYLLGILGVAIGIGSVVAGLVSGKHIEPRLIPIGAVGMTVFFLALGLAPLKFGVVAGLLLPAGFFAGFYIVPLQALLQYLSPADERGRFLGTANAMSFVCSSIGSVLFIVARKWMGLEANRVFLICAALSLFGSGALIVAMRKVIADPSLRRPDRAS